MVGIQIGLTLCQAQVIPAIAGDLGGKAKITEAIVGGADGDIHKSAEEYWKLHLGSMTKMPKAIKDCLNGYSPILIFFLSFTLIVSSKHKIETLLYIKL